MIRILTSIALAAIALVSSSCFCCTSDAKVPRLKRLPKFRQFPPAPEAAPEVPEPAPVVSDEK